jgi:MFS transporter, FSR family, fosmidomycin resistance protein
VFGLLAAAWPLIRTDLDLGYAEIGLLMSVPALVSTVIDPVIGVAGDAGHRRALVVGGGAGFALAALATALAPTFAVLLVALVAFFPASTALVSLSQATLMDHDPEARERNMARWTAAGSIGVVASPLLLAGGVTLGAGWRGAMLSLAGVALVLTLLVRGLPIAEADGEQSLRAAARGAVAAFRSWAVIRWLLLLEASDLLLDVLHGFLALYFVDVAGLGPVEAGLALGVWTVAGLAGDLLLVPLLARVRGVVYLRVSAAAVALVYPAFLLVDGVAAKLVLLGALGLLNAGWYAIPKAGLYSALPGRSGTALAIGSVTGLVGSLLPITLGLLAERYGLEATMWLLLAGPLALLVGLPRRSS